MQSAYMGKLMEIAERDKCVLHLLADSGTGYDELFRRNFPDQIINFGIAEENMVAAAAGMATVGKIPFVYTAGAFLAYRSLEFIRDDICFQNLNVKIVGMGSGLAWSSLGPTHHTTEDIAVLRAIPNLMILSPGTPIQVSESVRIAHEHYGPVYIRIGMNHEREFYGDDYVMIPIKNDCIKEGVDIIIYTTGSILDEVSKAADILQNQGMSVSVVNVSTIKPFDEADILRRAVSYQHIFVVEEHNVYGGLGSVISEVIAKHAINTQVVDIGIPDIFALGYGSQAQVRKANGLDSDSIVRRIKEVMDK